MVNRQSSTITPSSPTSALSSLTAYIHPIYFETPCHVFIFVYKYTSMGLLDLDKIIIKRTVVGIRCTSCGGGLEIAKKKSFISLFIKLVSFGTIRPKKYECENCKKKYLLI